MSRKQTMTTWDHRTSFAADAVTLFLVVADKLSTTPKTYSVGELL